MNNNYNFQPKLSVLPSDKKNKFFFLYSVLTATIIFLNYQFYGSEFNMFNQITQKHFFVGITTIISLFFILLIGSSSSIVIEKRFYNLTYNFNVLTKLGKYNISNFNKKFLRLSSLFIISSITLSISFMVSYQYDIIISSLLNIGVFAFIFFKLSNKIIEVENPKIKSRKKILKVEKNKSTPIKKTKSKFRIF